MLTASLVGATVKMYTATAEDYASEAESQDIAKLRARDKVIKKATKEAGVYLKTYSRSVDNELTDDEITAITSNSWQLVGEPKFSRSVKQVSDETSIIVWTATVEVNVDDAELQSWLNRDGKDKSTIITQTREAQNSFDENERTIEDLSERYNQTASQDERDKIRQQIDDADRDFLANQKLEDGNKLYYAKDYDGAIRLYGEAVELKPDWSWPYHNRGNAYYYLKQYERAIQDFDKALQLDPNFANAYYNRGICYTELKQYERAIQDFDKALTFLEQPFFYCNRGEAYYHLKNHKQAIADYTKALQLDPNYANAYNNRGNAYLSLGQYERALADCTKAIQLNPNFAEAYHNRGNAYLSLGQYERALADATKAIELNPNLVLAYKLRGLCYQQLGDEAKAQADFDKARELGFNG